MTFNLSANLPNIGPEELEVIGRVVLAAGGVVRIPPLLRDADVRVTVAVDPFTSDVIISARQREYDNSYASGHVSMETWWAMRHMPGFRAEVRRMILGPLRELDPTKSVGRLIWVVTRPQHHLLEFRVYAGPDAPELARGWRDARRPVTDKVSRADVTLPPSTSAGRGPDGRE